MTLTSSIIIHHLNYSFSNERLLFQDLSLTFAREKSGLVGKNGVGKSTLLRLILGEITPGSGTIHTTGKIAYCPQQIILEDDEQISDVLGIRDKLAALQRISQGSIAASDFAILNEDWQIEQEALLQLRVFGLAHLPLNRLMKHLSGGEKTRLYLAKCFLVKPDFIILDEPTNNLDADSRLQLYAAIREWKGGMLIISHDRSLLNLMTEILELTGLGANNYGGNYDDYCAQQSLQLAAKEKKLADARKSLQNTQSAIQSSVEKLREKQKQGQKLRNSGSQAKVILDGMKERSEKTQNRYARKNQLLLEQAEQEFTTAKTNIEISYEIAVSLPVTSIPNDKIVLELEDLSYAYPLSEANISAQLLIDHYNLRIVGPERIALSGNNGSGKTTLIKLILRELTPISGHIKLGVSHISYLDQALNFLKPELSVLENFQRINPDIEETQARLYLAQFLFRNVQALKKVATLSGGERLRAMLACVLMARKPPQLLILDEPTNHLDLISIASIESALKNYRGALLVISHDAQFLENIGINRVITAPL